MSLIDRIPPPARAALGRVAERVLLQPELADERGDLHRGNPAAALTTALSKPLIERGATPPWMWSQERCQQFWATRSDDADPNHPSEYAGKSQAIVDFLRDFWCPEIDPAMSVLEVGPNAGANLAGLHRHGFRDLAGIETNPAAVEEMGRAFPQLGGDAKVTVGRLEDVLPTLPDASVDVVFSMAVLIHVHPSSTDVLRHMARVARRYVSVVEAEHASAGYVFPRNYRRVFAGHGCAQVKSVSLTRRSHPDVDPGYYGYTARLFRAPSARS